jgi:hypothetical protein
MPPVLCSACGSRTRVPWLRTRDPFRWTNAPSVGWSGALPLPETDQASAWAYPLPRSLAHPWRESNPHLRLLHPYGAARRRSFPASFKGRQLRTGRPGSRPRAPVLGWRCLAPEASSSTWPRTGFAAARWWAHSESLVRPEVSARPSNYLGRAQADGRPERVVIKDRTAIILALPTRFELAALRSTGGRSNHLSYRSLCSL